MKRLMLAVAVAAFGVAGTLAEEEEMIKIPGKGKMVFVNTCDADNRAFVPAEKAINGMLMLDTEIRKGSWKLTEAKKCMGDATVALFLVKDKTLPISLIAMEEKWGVVNAEVIAETNLHKEVTRVATVLLGSASSKYPASALSPAFSSDDLNKVGDLITIDSLMAIFPNLEKHGFKQYRKMTREDAIEEGLIKDDKKTATPKK